MEPTRTPGDQLYRDEERAARAMEAEEKLYSFLLFRLPRHFRIAADGRNPRPEIGFEEQAEIDKAGHTGDSVMRIRTLPVAVFGTRHSRQAPTDSAFASSVQAPSFQVSTATPPTRWPRRMSSRRRMRLNVFSPLEFRA